MHKSTLHDHVIFYIYFNHWPNFFLNIKNRCIFHKLMYTIIYLSIYNKKINQAPKFLPNESTTNGQLN